MNTDTGRIISNDDLALLGEADKAKHIPMSLDPTPIQRGRQRVSRNDPCPCGSGKKFKKCHYTGGR